VEDLVKPATLGSLTRSLITPKMMNMSWWGCTVCASIMLYFFLWGSYIVINYAKLKFY